ncbi:unnamed protein product [Amoebophrya sp. A120]|nr:unnamed protein product [Amoebophrya sp. A120]|eukprot:GSA120T00005274001.1
MRASPRADTSLSNDEEDEILFMRKALEKHRGRKVLNTGTQQAHQGARREQAKNTRSRRPQRTGRSSPSASCSDRGSKEKTSKLRSRRGAEDKTTGGRDPEARAEDVEVAEDFSSSRRQRREQNNSENSGSRKQREQTTYKFQRSPRRGPSRDQAPEEDVYKRRRPRDVSPRRGGEQGNSKRRIVDGGRAGERSPPSRSARRANARAERSTGEKSLTSKNRRRRSKNSGRHDVAVPSTSSHDRSSSTRNKEQSKERSKNRATKLQKQSVSSSSSSSPSAASSSSKRREQQIERTRKEHEKRERQRRIAEMNNLSDCSVEGRRDRAKRLALAAAKRKRERNNSSSDLRKSRKRKRRDEVNYTMRSSSPSSRRSSSLDGEQIDDAELLESRPHPEGRHPRLAVYIPEEEWRAQPGEGADFLTAVVGPVWNNMVTRRLVRERTDNNVPRLLAARKPTCADDNCRGKRQEFHPPSWMIDEAKTSGERRVYRKLIFQHIPPFYMRHALAQLYKYVTHVRHINGALMWADSDLVESFFGEDEILERRQQRERDGLPSRSGPPSRHFIPRDEDGNPLGKEAAARRIKELEDSWPARSYELLSPKKRTPSDPGTDYEMRDEEIVEVRRGRLDIPAACSSGTEADDRRGRTSAAEVDEVDKKEKRRTVLMSDHDEKGAAKAKAKRRRKAKSESSSEGKNSPAAEVVEQSAEHLQHAEQEESSPAAASCSQERSKSERVLQPEQERSRRSREEDEASNEDAQERLVEEEPGSTNNQEHDQSERRRRTRSEDSRSSSSHSRHSSSRRRSSGSRSAVERSKAASSRKGSERDLAVEDIFDRERNRGSSSDEEKSEAKKEERSRGKRDHKSASRREDRGDKKSQDENRRSRSRSESSHSLSRHKPSQKKNHERSGRRQNSKSSKSKHNSRISHERSRGSGRSGKSSQKEERSKNSRRVPSDRPSDHNDVQRPAEKGFGSKSRSSKIPKSKENINKEEPRSASASSFAACSSSSAAENSSVVRAKAKLRPFPTRATRSGAVVGPPPAAAASGLRPLPKDALARSSLNRAAAGTKTRPKLKPWKGNERLPVQCEMNRKEVAKVRGAIPAANSCTVVEPQVSVDNEDAISTNVRSSGGTKDDSDVEQDLEDARGAGTEQGEDPQSSKNEGTDGASKKRRKISSEPIQRPNLQKLDSTCFSTTSREEKRVEQRDKTETTRHNRNYNNRRREQSRPRAPPKQVIGRSRYDEEIRAEERQLRNSREGAKDGDPSPHAPQSVDIPISELGSGDHDNTKLDPHSRYCSSGRAPRRGEPGKTLQKRVSSRERRNNNINKVVVAPRNGRSASRSAARGPNVNRSRSRSRRNTTHGRSKGRRVSSRSRGRRGERRGQRNRHSSRDRNRSSSSSATGSSGTGAGKAYELSADESLSDSRKNRNRRRRRNNDIRTNRSADSGRERREDTMKQGTKTEPESTKATDTKEEPVHPIPTAFAISSIVSPTSSASAQLTDAHRVAEINKVIKVRMNPMEKAPHCRILPWPLRTAGVLIGKKGDQVKQFCKKVKMNCSITVAADHTAYSNVKRRFLLTENLVGKTLPELRLRGALAEETGEIGSTIVGGGLVVIQGKTMEAVLATVQAIQAFARETAINQSNLLRQAITDAKGIITEPIIEEVRYWTGVQAERTNSHEVLVKHSDANRLQEAVRAFEDVLRIAPTQPGDAANLIEHTALGAYLLEQTEISPTSRKSSKHEKAKKKSFLGGAAGDAANSSSARANAKPTAAATVVFTPVASATPASSNRPENINGAKMKSSATSPPCTSKAAPTPTLSTSTFPAMKKAPQVAAPPVSNCPLRPLVRNAVPKAAVGTTTLQPSLASFGRPTPKHNLRPLTPGMFQPPEALPDSIKLTGPFDLDSSSKSNTNDEAARGPGEGRQTSASEAAARTSGSSSSTDKNPSVPASSTGGQVQKQTGTTVDNKSAPVVGSTSVPTAGGANQQGFEPSPFDTADKNAIKKGKFTTEQLREALDYDDL